MALHSEPYDDLQLFKTSHQACGYWPDRSACNLVIDPSDARLSAIYPQALAWGFRRSGNLLYRPHCKHCGACIPVRINVNAFVPNRSQRRCLARNATLVTRIVPAERSAEHLSLYRRYLHQRHPDGGMEGHGANEFDQFLIGRWGYGRFMEIREPTTNGTPGQLLAVAVTDLTEQALSAVYTFYEPDAAARGLGTLAILHQIHWAQREQRPYLYLGYWIKDHFKMDYKRRFQALEMYDGNHWRHFTSTYRSTLALQPAQPASHPTTTR
ncbi:MAG TPA: arginyltransferase [Xylella taiwanensis]